MKRINKKVLSVNRYFSFIKYVTNPVIIKRIVHIFFFSREGFIHYLKETFRIFLVNGFDGLINGLDNYSDNKYQKPT